MSIFEEQLSRKPNHYPWTEQFIEAMHNGFWTDKEFSFKSDVQQYKTELTKQEQDIIRVLSLLLVRLKLLSRHSGQSLVIIYRTLQFKILAMLWPIQKSFTTMLTSVSYLF